jgi:hypothetical protein
MEKAKRARKAETPKQTKPLPQVARAVPLSRPKQPLPMRIHCDAAMLMRRVHRELISYAPLVVFGGAIT